MSESLNEKIKSLKENAIEAGLTGANSLIEVAKSDIMRPKAGDPLAADKMKQAAAAIKMALFDCFEILSRVEEEDRRMNESEKDDTEKKEKVDTSDVEDFKFAEGRAR